MAILTRSVPGLIERLCGGGFESSGAAGTGGNHLPQVSHVNEGHEDVGAVGVQPEALDPVTGRNELAVINAGAIS